MSKKRDDPSIKNIVTDKTLLDAIHNTGFELEYRISEVLRKSRWTVINNKYYVDDQQEKVREIDLVAYKMSKVSEMDIYTTLIISCKKSATKVWAFLAKNINTNDPNINWLPLSLWSNDKAVNFIRRQPKWEDSYFHRLKDFRVTNLADIPDVHIFAFQEVDGKKPPNNGDIFDSITSLMKAQAYEIESLPQRKSNSCVYQFNLLSVVEADMREVFFGGEEPKVRQIEEAHHVAGFIINKKQTFARVHFIHSCLLQEALKEYDRLHEGNCKILADDYEAFYQDILQDSERKDVFKEEFRNAVHYGLRYRVPESRSKEPRNLDHLWLRWNAEEQQPEMALFTADEDIEFLNGDSRARQVVEDALYRYYKYKGNFRFAVIF